MKLPRALCLLLVFLSLGGALLRAAPTSVEQWGLYEVALKGPADGNPFVDVRLTATFTDGVRKVEVNGFYDGDGVYRVRFMPETTGEWRYETKSNRWALTDKSGVFTVTPATGKNRGPVRVRNTYHFAYADGSAFKPIGTTIYSWTHRPAAMEEETLKTLATAPFNKVRMLVFPQAHGVKFMPVERWPYVGKAPRDWDYTRFNPDFFQHLEKRVGQLRDLGIECDLILFHPYDDDEEWGFETMSTEADDHYLRYLVARLAAYRNIWWSIGNEYDFLRTKTVADWDRYFQVVQANDPYNHLRSIHNGHLLYDNGKPWVTHSSIQNGMAAAEPGRAELYRDVWRKPVVYDELNYEGNHELRWAQLSGRDMVRNFWNATVAGTYGGHSEFFEDERQVVWLAQGGKLKGESAPRLAFLRKILEDAPASGLDPIDQWRDVRLVGKAGEYYLVYFGEKKPTSWAPSLYRNGLVEGMQFQVDVIDTWDMTITPVEGAITLKKKNRYVFADRDGREINLPGKPYQAIRLRWVGGPKPQPVVKAPVEP
ncbi:DUF5060 domain-containing protein [Oleiharenicola lentus]|uniref:DUF5060 domain-containing protein n=1 Tax=Oleiharenicola lentus TaxID=2508720 RepID=UPI003F67525C